MTKAPSKGECTHHDKQNEQINGKLKLIEKRGANFKIRRVEST